MADTDDRASRFTPHPPEVKARARELFDTGMSKVQIATELGVSRPTLTKWLGASEPAAQAAPGVTPEDAGEAIIRDITSAKGKRKRGPDPQPRQRPASGAPAPGSGTSKVSDAELTKALAEALCFPAIPMGMIVGCSFCAQHFADTGGPAAVELVRMSQNSPGLRTALERLHGIYRMLMTGGVLAMYAGKPLAHHLAPADVLAFAGPFIGVPPRPGMQGHPGVVVTPMPGAGHVHYDGSDAAHPEAGADPRGADPAAVAADAA